MSVRSPMAMFSVAMTPHSSKLFECALSFLHFSFLNLLRPLFCSGKECMIYEGLFLPVTEQKWAKKATSESVWEEEREKEKKKVWDWTACCKAWWSEQKYAFQNWCVCLRERSSSFSDLSTVNEEVKSDFSCSYISPASEDENRTDLCSFTPNNTPKQRWNRVERILWHLVAL